jgi:tetratricopeptide (TPR) repeat protein
MNCTGIVTGFALFVSGAAFAQPAWVKQQVRTQVEQSQLRMMIGRSSGGEKGDQTGLPTFVTVFTKAKTYQGLGHFRLQEGSGLRGVKESAYIRMDGMNIFPEATDSIECMGETGLRGESGWLFRTLRGKITAFSPMPGGKATHVSYDNGPIQEIKDGELEKALQPAPIAYAFLNRDRDYALGLFNKYHSLDVYDPKAGLSLSELRQSLFNYSGNWAQEKAKPSDGLIVRLGKVRYACQNRKYDDGLGALGELEKKFPDLYLPYALEGECYEKQGNRQAAIEAYVQARTYAPEDPKLVEKLSEGISRLRWEAQEISRKSAGNK